MSKFMYEQVNYLFASLVFACALIAAVKGGIFGAVVAILTFIVSLILKRSNPNGN